MQKRILILALAVVAGLGLAALLAFLNKPAVITQAPVDPNALIAVTDDAFGGAFTLTDHTGKTVTEKDFTGKYRLIFFGFTHCPAICPTELQKITMALNDMGDKGKLVQPVYVTVDPERDTVDVMKNYVSLFHPSLIGLTGTPEHIKDMLKTYKVYASKVNDPQMTEYTMDHSSFIYFMAPDDRLLHIFKMPDQSPYLAETMTRWIDYGKQ